MYYQAVAEDCAGQCVLHYEQWKFYATRLSIALRSASGLSLANLIVVLTATSLILSFVRHRLTVIIIIIIVRIINHHHRYDYLGSRRRQLRGGWSLQRKHKVVGCGCGVLISAHSDNTRVDRAVY